MNLRDEVDSLTSGVQQLDAQIERLTTTLSQLRAVRGQMATLRDRRQRQLDVTVEQVMNTALNQPTPDEVWEFDEQRFGEPLVYKVDQP